MPLADFGLVVGSEYEEDLVSPLERSGKACQTFRLRCVHEGAMPFPIKLLIERFVILPLNGGRR
jgi:hypothetical protein